MMGPGLTRVCTSSVILTVGLNCSSQTSKWLSDLDSNQDKILQRDLCYHYTIGQLLRN